MIEQRRKVDKWVHGKELAVLVEVERIEVAGDPWAPYLEPEGVRKLEAAQRAADAGDVSGASRYGKVFRLTEIAPSVAR